MAEVVQDMTADKDMTAEKPARWRRAAPLIAIIAILGLAYAAGLHRYISYETLVASYGDLRAWIAERPVMSGLAFVTFYAVAVTISLPGALWFTIAGGLLFGWALGGLYSYTGALIGATLIFLAVKTAFGDVLREKAGDGAAQFQKGFERDAFSYLLMLRIIPLPFFLINVAAGLFDVRARTYVTATAIGIIPGTFAYAAIGAGAGDAVAKGESLNLAFSSLLTDPKIIGAFGVIIALSVGQIGLKRLRAKIEDAPENEA